MTALHDSRLKKRFGDNRRFIRCNQFPSSQAIFLSRLSEVIGAGIENPGDLTPLRGFLSSEEMIIVLDNAESILDPEGTDGREIYHLVKELSEFTNICLVVTSQITTIPPNCKTLDIPTLLMKPARDTFHRIYSDGEQSDEIGRILKEIDFHPLCITLLATVAHQNKWGCGRLIHEWDKHRTAVLQTEHNESLGAVIELALDSPMFKKLDPNARGLLEVVAFFPQGINEEHSDWLFPTIPNVTAILDKFCVLSLTSRSGGFITMLGPLQDYLRPKDPLSSPLLHEAKESYFTRLSAKSDPNTPGSEETEWIISEDANVEHLLNVLTSIDASSDRVWSACANFMNLLYWHKPRQTILGTKIKQLSDDRRFKVECLHQLSWLFEFIGNEEESTQLLKHAEMLSEERGNDY